jgi:hypothetical protein
MKFYSFYTENLSHIQKDHKKCCDKLGLEVVYYKDKQYNNYEKIYSAHGNFMTSVLENEPDDVIGFLDIDCLPYHKNNIEKAYSWAKENNSFVGNAQNISHTPIRNRLYAAASFLIISKTAWKRLGSPSLSWFVQNDTQIDTAQILSLRSDEIGFPYQLMYPIGYDGDNHRALGTYGNYGTGTLYSATYHYFRVSEFKDKIPDHWTKRVNNILNNQKIIPNYSSCFYGL